MKFIIRNNENARKEWKLISNVLFNWIFMPLFLIQGFVKWKFADKDKFHESLMYELYIYVGGIAVVISILLNFVHWIKPKWFEHRTEEV